MNFRGILLVCALCVPVVADEGLWLFNQFPKGQVQQKYGYEVTDGFLERLRLGSLKIGHGSGSFVSPNGLVFTSHRVAAACIGKHLNDGFYAPTPAEEPKCPEFDATVLLTIEDVTRQVKDAAKESAKASEALQKRTAAMARIETACAAKTGNSCAVVKLSSGERYDLYEYKRYTDLRLVFAPENAIATFGGDASNFVYPRYALDIAFLRAYENGKPADTPHYLKWNAEGVNDTDLIFVAGSPGGTSRLATAAQLAFYRDTALPASLSRVQARIELLRAFSAKSADNLRIAQPLLSALGNTYKSEAGKLIGLKDDRLMPRKANFERRLRTSVERDPKLGTEAGKVWDEVAAAYKTWTPFEKQFQILEQPAATGSTLFAIARQIVRHEPISYAGTNDESLEIAMLAQYLEDLKALGDKDAPVKAVLGGRTPQQAAEELVHSSKLKDPAERTRLSPDSDDALIRLARLLEDPARKLRKKHEESIESLEASGAERIAQYRFRVYGASDYPDATSTPRVTFGIVRAYRDKTEAAAPYATTFGGLFHLAGNREPYQLPRRWADGKAVLDLVMPFNFASTCDITGESSGSPAVNRKGEIVGMVFDGNIESLALTYLYSDDQARAVHVASQGIVEALRKLYKTPGLLQELLGPGA
jgi:Peptidase S46